MHHNPPIADGGSGAPHSGMCLVCVTCHAEETERQELKGGGNKALLESQLSPDIMKMFETTPRPRQLCWGDAAARACALAADDFTPLTCMALLAAARMRCCRANIGRSAARWTP